jgi:imidazolonepropionase-like amidohydrolase
MSIPNTPSPRGRVVVRAARLFDGTSDTLMADPLVLIEDGVVVSVTPGRDAVPEGVELVDLPGATLMPGLVDTHVHLVFDSSLAPVDNLSARNDDEVVAAAREAARTALLGGVTTMRDLGDRDYLTLGLRGDPELPTILCAGPPVTTPAGHCHFLGGAVADSDEGVREGVRARAARGVDVVKVMSSGGQMTPGTFQERAQFRPEVLTSIVEEAHALGLPVVAHAHGTDAIRDCLDAGVDGMEHVSFWSVDGVDDPGDLLDRIIEQGVIVGATFGIRQVEGLEPPPEILVRLAPMMANMARLCAGGARVVVGSDAGIAPVKPPDALRYALPMLAGLGMTPAASLRTVTSQAAASLALGDRKGRVAPGYDADLLAVAGDPLTDLEAIHRIEAVFRAGVRVR